MVIRLEIRDQAGSLLRTVEDARSTVIERPMPDTATRIRVALPSGSEAVSLGAELRVYANDTLLGMGRVTRTWSSWHTGEGSSDREAGHEARMMEATWKPAMPLGGSVTRYRHMRVDAIVKDGIQQSPGSIHYRIAHDAYPDGAQREYTRFIARRNEAHALGSGPDAQGRWIGPDRIDTSEAFIRDGQTIAGLVVDGVAWPDVRLLMADCEEASLNTRALARHPETAGWTPEQYAASPYGAQGEAAREALAAWLEEKGVAYLELEPLAEGSEAPATRRFDTDGRVWALAYGGGECANAAMVELGYSEPRWQEGGHAPVLGLKDYFSYTGPSEESIAECPVELVFFEPMGGLREALTVLAYAAGGWVWSLDAHGAIRFEPPDQIRRVVFHEPCHDAIRVGSEADGLINTLALSGHPMEGAYKGTHIREASVQAFGKFTQKLACYMLGDATDLARFAEAWLDAHAYPARTGWLRLAHGDTSITPGDLVELRGEEVRRPEPPVDGEWGSRFDGRIVARARCVKHCMEGGMWRTEVELGPPMDSVKHPLTLIEEGQPDLEELWQFQLDIEHIGLDLPYHID